MLKIIYAISVISGTVIGVGLFAIPFLTLHVGLWVMLGYFFVLGIVSILIHYFLGEIVLQSPDFIRIPGFAKLYLGENGYKVALFSGIVGLFGACLAYLILGGEFLSAILVPIFGGSTEIYTWLYFLIGSALIYLGIKAIDKVQFWGLVLFLMSLITLFFKGKDHIDVSNFLVFDINRSYFFLPYGVILFSLWGLSLVPETEELLGKQRLMLRKIIPIAIIIPIIIYFFFTFIVLSITGEATTPSALTGLQDIFGNGVTAIILFLGVIITFTSFIALGLTLKKIFWFDLKIKKNLSWMIACFVPIFLFTLGFKDYIRVVGFVGGIMLAIDGILVTLMYQKIKPLKVRFITYPLIVGLILGIIYELIYTANII